MSSKRFENLHSRYVDNLKQTLDVEREMIHATPRGADASTDEQLVNEFRDYMKQTENHLARLEQLLRRVPNKARA
ncbi:MAG: DUF892 family protein [Edaphobacter sp.]|uniref:DUF892 family protein n=1 Tax=Edaphobacter sp. TaxID=1934404 RepID=UPI00239BAC09|nr:DUF892 family protein [Edaphobacter sp.]MDE1177341.1 DUF892 family protein [Edaphobacter sp.]